MLYYWSVKNPLAPTTSGFNKRSKRTFVRGQLRHTLCRHATLRRRNNVKPSQTIIQDDILKT